MKNTILALLAATFLISACGPKPRLMQVPIASGADQTPGNGSGDNQGKTDTSNLVCGFRFEKASREERIDKMRSFFGDWFTMNQSADEILRDDGTTVWAKQGYKFSKSLFSDFKLIFADPETTTQIGVDGENSTNYSVSTSTYRGYRFIQTFQDLTAKREKCTVYAVSLTDGGNTLEVLGPVKSDAISEPREIGHFFESNPKSEKFSSTEPVVIDTFLNDLEWSL